MSTEITLEHLKREDWLALRKIGSSDAAAIVGLNPWRSPFAVWAEKVGLTEPTEETEAMRWGTKLEPVIATEFGERTSLAVQKCMTMFVHCPHDMLTATPDYLVVDGQTGLLEIKNVGVRGGAAWEDGIPDSVHVQAAHQMMVTGYPFAYVCGLIGGNKLAWKRVERDERVEKALMGTLLSFWDMVQTKTPPPVTADDGEILSAIYPESKAGTVALPDNAMTLAELYREAKARAKDWDEQAAEAANQLKQMLGESERGQRGELVVQWKTIQRKAYEVKASSYRKLTIMGGGNGEG